MTGPRGRVLVPRGWAWDKSIDEDDREAIVQRGLLLPAWVDNQLEAQNLDVRKLEESNGLWRLRVGAYRVVFQILAGDVIVQKIFRRREADDYAGFKAIPLVRSRGGLRTLVDDVEEPPPVPQSERPIQRASRREPIQNPLSPFTDAELSEVGLTAGAIGALREVPPELLPDRVLRLRGVDPEVIRFVAELWERPEDFVGRELQVELMALTESDAAERLASEYSTLSLLPVDDASAFLALLDGTIEDWMVYLHPLQSAAAKRPVKGPSRVRGPAGTGKTVVALHRARFLANETGGEVLLTTFVNNLPGVWQNLRASFPDDIRGRIHCRTINQVARELYYSGGGKRDIADESQREALIHDVWNVRRSRLAGLSALGLGEELDHMIIGRSLVELDAYLELPRTGRGTPLPLAARQAVWEAYEDYSRKMGRAKLTYWPELRRDALIVLQGGKARLSLDAIVADEAQDLGEAGIRLLAELCGGLPLPNLSLVGDGQQAIFPGGFSLLQLGIDVRGRSTVLRTNWRNSYMIWRAAQAFIQGEGYDDLEGEPASARDDEETPLPMRESKPPGLWIAPAGEDVELAVEIVREAIDLGADPGDTAVLAPSNPRANRMRLALESAGIPADQLTRYAGIHEPVVRVGTFHRAKGLEFKHVVVTGLDGKAWPPNRPGLDPLAAAEAQAREVRAAFVAMTRARDRLDVAVSGEPTARLAAAAWAFDQY